MKFLDMIGGIFQNTVHYFSGHGSHDDTSIGVPSCASDVFCFSATICVVVFVETVLLETLVFSTAIVNSCGHCSAEHFTGYCYG